MSEEPRLGSLSVLVGARFVRLAYAAWGDPARPPVLCVHGLTRNGRDFDPLARRLARSHHVICVDLPGRGRSDWLTDPTLYQPPTYAQALAALLTWLDRPVIWVGTSLGGICGMLLASAHGAPITRMVLNDIGPFIPKAALERIASYIGERPRFADLAEAEAHLRRVHAPFGALSDADWAHMARHGVRPAPEGGLVPHFDPAIAGPILANEPADVDLWPVWAGITAPRLVVRGESSDLLLAETLARMASEGAQTLVVRDAGHAPALMDAASIEAVARFVEAEDRPV